SGEGAATGLGSAAKALRLQAAGVAVKAADTGRVLLIQRSNQDQEDPARGRWEFPGGHIEDGEDAYTAACREWQEETGATLPEGQLVGTWISSSGVYRGFVYLVQHESDVHVNLDADRRSVLNPDDPDHDDIGVAAWWDPHSLPGMPALRAEVNAGTDWRLLTAAGAVAKSLREEVERELGGDLARMEASLAAVAAAVEGRP